MLIVGIDCATLATKTGLSLAEYEDGVLTIRDCIVGRSKLSVAELIHPWLKSAKVALIALDSRLGWPATMGSALSQHTAGVPIPMDSNDLFRRRTDSVVRREIGKNPLEIGADRIGRTAVTALAMIGELGLLCGQTIDLAWSKGLSSGIYAIEVYPAGTLRACEGSARRPGDVVSRKKALLEKLNKEGRLSLQSGLHKAIDNVHVLDSVLCAVAAMDFLDGTVIHPRPDEEALVRKEGWIWVRSPMP